MGGTWSKAQHAKYKATMAAKSAGIAAATTTTAKARNVSGADEALGAVLRDYVIANFGSLPFVELVKQASARNLNVRLIVELE